MKPLLMVTVLALATLFPAPLLHAQSVECGAEEGTALLQPTDSAYDEAIELARTLSERHFTIQCILTSKLGGFFEGTTGSALYRTSDGDLGVVFLSRGRTFADLKIVERPLKKGFAYSFSGKPRPLPASRLQSARRQYFLKHENHLLILGDDALKSKLESALNLHAE